MSLEALQLSEIVLAVGEAAVSLAGIGLDRTELCVIADPSLDRNTHEVLAEGTNQFLEAQLEDARRRLVDTEQKVQEYRRAHAEELPEQRDGNLQALRNFLQAPDEPKMHLLSAVGQS